MIIAQEIYFIYRFHYIPSSRDFGIQLKSILDKKLNLEDKSSLVVNFEERN